MKKIKKLIKNPGIFFRDYLNKKHPIIRNEILCPEFEESVLIKHDLALENLMRVDFPIDVVFTWVDDSDEEWKKKYLHFKSCIETHTLGNFATDTARFSNHDELRYSLKSIERYLPWVRHIFIVTDNQKPIWLNLDDRIKIVDHRDIIDHQYLPTFNSHVIEAHLHKIPGLAEHFIYFNDDVFVARPLPAGHFFKSNGLSSLFLSRKSLAAMQKRGVSTPTLSASLHASDIFFKEFQIVIDTPLVHTYVPLRRSIFELAWNEYGAEIKHFLPHKFRTDHDMNLATFFIPWLSYIMGKATPARDICYYFNIRSRAAKSSFKALKQAKKEGTLPHSFCANDFNTEIKSIDNYKLLLINALENQFPSNKKPLI